MIQTIVIECFSLHEWWWCWTCGKNIHTRAHMMLSLSVFFYPNFHRGNSILTIHDTCMNFPYRFFQSCSILSSSLFVCLFSEKLSLLPKMNIGIYFTFETMQTNEWMSWTLEKNENRWNSLDVVLLSINKWTVLFKLPNLCDWNGKCWFYWMLKFVKHTKSSMESSIDAINLMGIDVMAQIWPEPNLILTYFHVKISPVILMP